MTGSPIMTFGRHCTLPGEASRTTTGRLRGEGNGGV